MSRGEPRQASTSLASRPSLFHVIPDILSMIAGNYLALWLRGGNEAFSEYFDEVTRLIPLILTVRLTTFYAFGVYKIIWRYISLNDALVLLKAILTSSAVILAITVLTGTSLVSRAHFIVSTLLLLVTSLGIRFSRRLIHEHQNGTTINHSGRRTLIYGAADHGRTLVQRFQSDRKLGFQVICFIDDDLKKLGYQISGVSVAGTGKDLKQVIANFQIQEVIIAITTPSGKLLREVMEVCAGSQIRPRLIKPMNQSPILGRNVELVREIELNDLLARGSRDIDLSLLKLALRDKVVLVTGAGGSIGSELARQIFNCSPQRLLLLDHSEFNLYQIDHELRHSQDQSQNVTPLLVDIKDKGSLKNVFSHYRPDFIFHAAAYKHVHLVEANPYPSILNNILGTKNLIELAEQYDTESFILVSSDKAVNPAGLMGATKRICELLVSDAGQRTGKRYAAVRFGNVLGSSGSLIPLLKRQIEEGGPITITDEKMKRFFMLIPEAVSLVLKAASIAKPADIMVLRMGEPIKIIDIARSLVSLMGKSENEVPIIFTGTRPGEKLFEELYLLGNEINTEDPDILVIPKGDGALAAREERLSLWVDNLIEAAKTANPEALRFVKAIVRSEYYPVQKSAPLPDDLIESPNHLEPLPTAAIHPNEILN